jgi:hypothetical protein
MGQEKTKRGTEFVCVSEPMEKVTLPFSAGDEYDSIKLLFRISWSLNRLVSFSNYQYV